MKFDDPFFFGVANAANQVEDGLHDTWLDWANENKGRAFNNFPVPNERLQFWTKPEVEIDLAAETGIQVFRMGLEWERIMPAPGKFDEVAIKRYSEILKMIKKKNMKVMLTLWHHAVPRWIEQKGGWTNDETQKHFFEFSKRAIKEFNSDVEWWLTFNEGNIFTTLAYSIGMWPPGEKRSPLSMAAVGPFRGDVVKSIDRMADSHIEIYKWAHKEFPQIKMGFAHNMAYYTGKSWIDRVKSSFVDAYMNWRFPERVRGFMDFFGFNYYGAEWLKGTQIDVDPEEEYSEAGRAVHPEGFYQVIKEIDNRFKGMPIIITENGMSDSLDIIKDAYLIEHLKVINKVRSEGIKVLGYVVWTLTDNFEWSDGYCPKFGMVAVDRANGLKRIKRESFFTFQKIVKSKEITQEMQDIAWKKVVDHQGKDRPFCRAADGISALDVPVMRPFAKKDWRFKR